MNRFSIVFILAVFVLGLGSCASETKSGDAEGGSDSHSSGETKNDSDSKEKTESSTVNKAVLNPNLANLEELAALPNMTSEIAQSIITDRPFMGMMEFHPFLKQYMGEAEMKALYEKLFLPINLNTAVREEIMLVPGIGEKMAHEFEEYRPYKAPAQFRREMGKYIDDAEITRFEQFVFVPVNLNTASDEHILSIPGMGKRMLHEFDEYRPYKSIEQFNREIGKYVDDNELARLRRYVFVPEA